MNSDFDIFGQVATAIKKQVAETFHDAGMTRELMKVIRDHLEISRGLLIWERTDDEWIVDDHGRHVFTSASFTACVEWALKQPMKAASDEQK